MRRSEALPPLVVPLLALLPMALPPSGPSALSAQQPAEWSVAASVGAWGVEDAPDWLELTERAERVHADGSRIGLEVASWRRFGEWDHAVEASGTLRASEDLWLHARGLVTPGARIREEGAGQVGASVALRPFSVGLSYQVRSFEEGTEHALLPEVTWYGGATTVFVRGWLMHTTADSRAGAGMFRVTHRVSDRVRLMWGGALGDEDFVVESAGGREVRTIRSETLLLGGIWDPVPDWTLRLDLAATDTDARLDRAGGTLTIRRSL